MRWLIIPICCFIAGRAAVAEPSKLGGDAIKQTVTGAMLALDTPLGSTVSIRFTNDGLMTGEARELAALLGAATDRGRWWVSGDRLCYKWFRWFESEPRCLDVQQDGARIFWTRDDGETGTATMIEQGAGLPPSAPAPSIVVAMKAEPKAEIAAITQPVPSRQLSPGPATTSLEPAKSSVAVAKKSATSASAPAPTRKVQSLKKPVPALPPQVTAPLRAQSPVAHPGTKLVAVALAPAVTPVAKPQSRYDVASFRVGGVRDNDVLNVRSGPSEYHDAIGIIAPSGRGITITGGCRADWCPIKHRSISGWVNRYYLVEELPR